MSDLDVQEIYDKAEAGDHKSIMSIVESVGNDDDVRDALITLLQVARWDEDDRWNKDIRSVRNNARLVASERFVLAIDNYLEGECCG